MILSRSASSKPFELAIIFLISDLNVARKASTEPKAPEKQWIPRRHDVQDLKRVRIGTFHLPAAYPRSDLALLRRLSPQRFRITGRLTPIYHPSRLVQRRLAPSAAQR
jgi:hypothetical protein